MLRLFRFNLDAKTRMCLSCPLWMSFNVIFSDKCIEMTVIGSEAGFPSVARRTYVVLTVMLLSRPVYICHIREHCMVRTVVIGIRLISDLICMNEHSALFRFRYAPAILLQQRLWGFRYNRDDLLFCFLCPFSIFLFHHLCNRYHLHCIVLLIMFFAA